MNFRSAIPLFACLICLCCLPAAAAPPLAVVDENLPPIEAGVELHVLLRATGGVPPYIWSVASGELPEGITLTPQGLLSGRATKPGSFSLTLKVEDSARPANAINKEFRALVSAPLLLEWLEPPKVHDNRIDGSVQVSNGSTNPFDLTVIVMAVAENGRATAIGYQHFSLKPGATNVKISFGDTLPHGEYVIHADAVAEIPVKKAILRQRLQTPKPLLIAQGP
ncbi:MAG: putative Ig domain-containing protein [Terriglobales bacterium]